MEWKTFIEASSIYNIHIEEKIFCSCYFWKFAIRFGQSKRTWSVLWSVWVFFAFIEKRRRNKYCLWEVNFISFMQIFSCVFAYFCGGHKNDFSLWFCSPYHKNYVPRTLGGRPRKSSWRPQDVPTWSYVSPRDTSTAGHRWDVLRMSM